MKRESQYLDSYLANNANRGWGDGLTIGTYLAYTLHGKAKRFADVYHRSLERALAAQVGQLHAILGPSSRGGVAYYPLPLCHPPQVAPSAH